MRLTAASVAIAVTLTISMIEAQQAPELKTVLHNAADALGMLRTEREADLIATLRYWGAGTMTVGGQMVKVTNYAGSVNFHVPGCASMSRAPAADGKPQRAVEVVSDKVRLERNAAWDECHAGCSSRQRSAPPVVDAAAGHRQGGHGGRCRREGRPPRAASPRFTFPIASIGATVKATLDDKSFIRDVEARMGTTVVTATYSDYGDWNGADYLSDVMFPRHIVQKRDGATVLDLTISKTNTYNPYVVMPVPENVGAQTADGAPRKRPAAAVRCRTAQAQNVPTPRMADGHPDLERRLGRRRRWRRRTRRQPVRREGQPDARRAAIARATR